MSGADTHRVTAAVQEGDMSVNSRITVVLSAASLLVTATGCTAGKDTSPSGKTTVSGSISGFSFGARVSAIAATIYGADDGLNVVVTDADDPCGDLIKLQQERASGNGASSAAQANTSWVILGFLDLYGSVKLSTASVAHSGEYRFVNAAPGDPGGASGLGRWFRVLGASHIDGHGAVTEPVGGASAGGGHLDSDVPLGGGTAVGHFSAQFAGGSASVDFDAPFCAIPQPSLGATNTGGMVAGPLDGGPG
jgi:hypothetical protein